MSYTTDEIKSRVKMPELLRHYGIDIVRGRIKCPLHNGDDNNCGVKDNYIHCFVCGESADQISFVMKYFKLSFQEAIKKLNYDFNLRLNIGTYDRRQELEMARRQFFRDRERKKAEEEKNKIYLEYYSAIDEFIFCERVIKNQRPKSEQESVSPVFLWAMANIEKARFNIELAEREIRKWLTQ